LKFRRIILIFVLSFGGFLGNAHSLPKETLKAYMYQFVTEASQLRMAEIKGSEPKWQEIQATLKDMKKTIQGMERADTGSQYRPWLRQLSGSVKQLEKMSLEKNPDIAAAYDRMTQQCLRCHTSHLRKMPHSFEEPLKTK